MSVHFEAKMGLYGGVTASPGGLMNALTRVYVDMVGDLFHPGHVALLRAAKGFGDQLVVGVLSDETASGYKRRPIMSMDERVAVIEACRYVDEVIRDSPDRVTREFLEEHHLALVVHGDDRPADGFADVYGPVVEAGLLRLVPRVGEISTTAVIARVREALAGDRSISDRVGRA